MVLPDPQNEQTLNQDNYYSNGSELTPAEVASRQERENSNMPQNPLPKVLQEQLETEVPDTTKGYTVSEQGLVNNYPVSPPVYEDPKSEVAQKRNQVMYAILGLVILGLLLVSAGAITYIS